MNTYVTFGDREDRISDGADEIIFSSGPNDGTNDTTLVDYDIVWT